MTTTLTPTIDIGIASTDREEIAGALSKLLADSYTLYLKTHNFHWNVTGPMFQTLHLMFEQQYTELALAVDLIAERIRALGAPAPGSYREFARLSSIKEAEGVPARDGHDPAARRRAGGRRADCACGVRHRRARKRSADRRSAHAADAGSREDGVDAAELAGVAFTCHPRASERRSGAPI